MSEHGLERLRTELRRRDAQDGQAALDQSLEASKGRSQSLAGFIREAWSVVEPGTPLVWGWHIDAICAHLEAVTYGKITRLLINVPPGTMKSLIVSVFWPAWEWGPAGLPHLRYYTTSFKDELVTRDTRKMRDLVFSPWFQERWSHLVEEVRGGEKNFSNSRQGWRIGSAWTSLTGERGHRLVIDDPHSTEQAESEADRKRAVRIFRESAPSRIVDPTSSAIIIVMQRLHAEDISGVALSLGGYVHLCLPMEFEPDRRCETSIGFRDPRTYDGELLFPERFTREAVDRDKAIMGSFAVAGQYQQRPTAREGGLFKESWFRYTAAPAPGTRMVRYWDLAATAETLGANPAYTAGVLMGRQPDGKFVIAEVIRMRAEGQGVRRLITETANDTDGKNVDIGFPQDPGQAGKVQAQDMVAMLAGFRARAFRESGDKVTRAEPLAAQAEAGNLLLVRGDWNKAFIDEAKDFPSGKFKDQIDAASGAFGMLLGATMFNTPEDHIAIAQTTAIPATWPRLCAWIVTKTSVAMAWMTYAPSTGTAYVFDAIQLPRREMAVHAQQFRARQKGGAWVPVMLDMWDDDRSEQEGRHLVDQMQELGIEVYHLDLDMEAACAAMNDRFMQGHLRVYSHIADWFGQYRRLARDDKGQIDDAEAGILRATGLALTGLPFAITETRAASDATGFDPADTSNHGGDRRTGY